MHSWGMAAWGRVARLGGGVLGAGIGLAGIGAIAALRLPLPRTSGTLRLPDLTAPVEVLRDRWGVPHIYARSHADLFMAQGYVHAQDRLWQMEFHRRIGHGQLAEVFGARALEADRFLRVLGFGRVTRREAALLQGEAREAAESYVRGVNAYIRQCGRRLPLEFTLLRLRPRPWEPADALVFAKVMAMGLSENWATEVLRARIVAAVGAARAAALEPGYPADHPLTIPPGVRYGPDLGAEALHGAAAAAAYTGSGATPQGSNAWAVSGARTQTGKPLLASDPHLAIQVPSLWYENHLVGGDYNVSGASVPGTFGVVIGHNERVAWGVTNGMSDVQDLYIETFDEADPTRYLFRDEWLRAEVVAEEITVRGRPEPVIENVLLTRHGPVITPLLDATDGASAPAKTAPAQPLALRWTALEPGRLARCILALNRAHDWESFRAALADWTVPVQNFVYADVDGHIGYALGGDVPVRARSDGRLPVPGASGEYEWTGIIPHADLPHALDPGEGFVVTANNRIAADAYPYPLPSEWLPGYRAARIRCLLEETPRHDAASFARIHADQRSLPGLRMAALVGSLPASTEVERLASAALTSWDGELTADSVAGTIYTQLCEALMAIVTADVAGPLDTVVRLGEMSAPPGEMYLARALPHVLRAATDHDDAILPPGRTWEDVLGAAWSTTIQGLRRRYGDVVATWTYGRAHTLTMRHPLSAIPLLGRLLNRGPFPTGGDHNTVCMGFVARPISGPPSYTAPSYRQICDTSNWDGSVSIHPTGQSGHPASRHYADMVQTWLKGQYHPMLWSRARIEEMASARLMLRP